MPRMILNGKEVEFKPGETLLEIAWREGYPVPVFCYHPSLGEGVATCRICLAEVEAGGRKGLLPTCTTRAADGMIVNTESPEVLERTRKGVLELLLANHPLDCPVCDAGGECDLQELTLKWGPDRSRYVFPRREIPRRRPGPFMELYPNRCVHCDRCVRFYQQIAGGGDWGEFEWGWYVMVGPAQEKILESLYSGNMVEICPLGAITGRDYRFKARPWEMEYTHGVSPVFSTGDTVKIYTRRKGLMSRGPFAEGGRRKDLHEVIRLYTLVNPETNGFFLDDATRFTFDFPQSRERHLSPQIRRNDELVPALWDETLERVEETLKGFLGRGREVAFLAGGVGTTEGAFLFERLARSVLHTPHLDSRRPEGGDEAVDPLQEMLDAAASPATFRDLEQADWILLWRTDVLHRWPSLGLRLVQARNRGARMVAVSFVDESSRPWKPEPLVFHPGEENALLRRLLSGELPEELEGLAAARKPLLVLNDALPVSVQRALLAFAIQRDLQVLYLRHAPNGQGFVDVGVHPGLLPGHLPAPHPGIPVARIPEAIRSGKIRALVLWGVDPLVEYPDRDAWEEALRALDFLLVIKDMKSPVDSFAHVILPQAVPFEVEGRWVNTVGFVQKSKAALSPAGLSRPDYVIWAEILRRLGEPVPDTADDIWEMVQARIPFYTGISGDLRIEEKPYPRYIPTVAHYREVAHPERAGYRWHARSVQVDLPPAERPEGMVLLATDHAFKAGLYTWRGELIQQALGELDLRVVAEAHPDTAADLGIVQDGVWVRLVRGEKEVRVRLRRNAEVPRGVIRVFRNFYDHEANRLLPPTGWCTVELKEAVSEEVK